MQKVHETVLEVNLNAMVDNLNYYRSFMKPETKLVCMIKADAYGAGSVEIAKTCRIIGWTIWPWPWPTRAPCSGVMV